MTHNTNKKNIILIIIIIYRQQTVAGVTDLHLEQIVLKGLIRSGSKAEEVTCNANDAEHVQAKVDRECLTEGPKLGFRNTRLSVPRTGREHGADQFPKS